MFFGLGNINDILKDVVFRIRQICSSENKFSEKLEEYMAYLISRCHVPEKLKSA